MIFEVLLRFRPHDGAPPAEDVAEELRLAGFTAEVEPGGYVRVDLHRVEATGLTAMPEALRKAHLSLSRALRDGIPALKDRGLLWSDVVSADVRAVG